MCIYIYVYIFVWLHVHAETFMANRWRHAVSVTFFSPRITHPRVTDLPSRAKLQIKRPTLDHTAHAREIMVWHGGVSIRSGGFFLVKKHDDLLPGTNILLGGNPSMMARLRLREDMKQWSAGCHASIWWRKLEILWRFFLGFQDIYILFYKFARTINLWTLQRLLRLWKNRSSTASSFRENPGLLGLNQGRMMGWLKYFEVLHLRCKP